MLFVGLLDTYAFLIWSDLIDLHMPIKYQIGEAG